jgi:hypothetical protein
MAGEGVHAMNTVMQKLEKAATDENGRVMPYAVAWFFGVPLSVLVLVWLFAHHH